MIPIAFDNIVYSLQRTGGVSRMWVEITKPYFNEAVFIERGGCTRNLYRKQQRPGFIHSDHPWPEKISRYLNFDYNFFAEPFIFHSSYYRINSSSFSINVTTIHDLIYERFGTGLGCYLHLKQKAVALRASRAIVCVSEHTRQDLLKFYSFCRDKDVIVIPNGVDQSAVTDSKEDVFRADDTRLQELGSSPFFLYVGNRGACKGFDRVHVALDALPNNYCCVVVGETFSTKERAVISGRGHQGRIINFGKVSDNALNVLYAEASFLFFPSLYEGFGIPPLEAMRAGCPVVAADRSSIPEVVGDAGLLFDPDDQAAISQAVGAIVREQVRMSLIARGFERVKLFPWQSAIDAYGRLYARLLHDI